MNAPFTPFYFDHNATTPVDPRVLEAMLPWLREAFGNPSSDHVYGRRAKAAVETARAQVAELIGARPGDIVFTGGATEANNLALWGAALARQSSGRGTLVTSCIEHPSVSQPLRELARHGWSVRELPVDASGRVRPAVAEKVIDVETALVSVMLANNETGSLQPVREIAAVAQARGALMHVDAAQAAGKIEVDVDDLGADLLTLAGHKFCAPKGVGALFVREGIALKPIMRGAGHERGLRPGTENVPYIVGLGEAARLARAELDREGARLVALRDDLHARLAAIPGLALNGHPSERLPNTLNVSFPGVAGWRLLEQAAGLAASTGSACHAGRHAGGGVLGAMGCDAMRVSGAVRLSLGRTTTAAEIESVAGMLIDAWRRLASA